MVTAHNSTVTFGLVQMSMVEEPGENLDRALALVAQAAAAGAKVVCLPELFRSPYFCIVEHSPRDYAEEVPGAVGTALSAAARRHGIVIVGGSVYELAAGGRFNTSLVYNPDGTLVGSYRKVHIPHDPGFYEQHYFAPGDLGFRVFDTAFCRIAVLICYDQWFPEAARAVALAGAEVIVYPTAIGTRDGVPQTEGDWQVAWETVQRGHAIANGVPVAGINRVGREGDTTFWGGSFLADAFGTILARGGAAEEVVLATIDRSHGPQVKEGWRFFYNRRPEMYAPLVAPRQSPLETEKAPLETQKG